MAASVSPQPTAPHNVHLNNHLHPSHHQQTQPGVCNDIKILTIFHSYKVKKNTQILHTYKYYMQTIYLLLARSWYIRWNC